MYTSAGSNYALLIKQSTEILLDLMGVEERTRAKLANWAGGPQSVWKNAASPKATDRVRASPVSRAWLREVTWLRDLAANSNAATSKVAEWNLRFYKHDLAVDDPYLQADAASFRAWAKIVSSADLQNQTWIKSFIAVASKEAEHADDKAARLASARFADWLQEGPAKGLKR